MLPLLYVVRMDVEKEYLPEFVRWYDTRHGPDLIDSGFHSCSAYHSVAGEPFICNVYEVPDLAVFSSDAYTAVRRNDRQLVDEVLHKISNHSNTVYEQREVVGVPSAALELADRPSRAGAVSAPVVSTLRFDIAEDAEAELLRWFSSVESGRLAAADGFLRARLACQQGKHPLFPSSQPEWLVLIEWANLAAARSDGAPDAVAARYFDGAGGKLTGLAYSLGSLSATLLNPHTWDR
jgi:hypothetical protein